MDMVERVARAICCPEGCQGDTGSGNPCDIKHEDKTAIQQAIAAIEAMREPDDGMRLASKRYKRKAKVYSGPQCYREMIDSILKSTRETQ